MTHPQPNPPEKVESLVERLRQGALDLHPYAVGDTSEPVMNCALPAYLNDAADRILALEAQVAGMREALDLLSAMIAENRPREDNDAWGRGYVNGLLTARDIMKARLAAAKEPSCRS